MSSAGSSTSPLPTRAAASRRASTMPRPMPPAPPVTTATLPLRSCTPPPCRPSLRILCPYTAVDPQRRGEGLCNSVLAELEHAVPGIEDGVVAEALDFADRRTVVEQKLEVGDRTPYGEVALGVLATDVEAVGVHGDQPLVALVAVQVKRLSGAPTGFDPVVDHGEVPGHLEDLLDTVGRQRGVDGLGLAGGCLCVIPVHSRLMGYPPCCEPRRVVVRAPRPPLGVRRGCFELGDEEAGDLCEPQCGGWA